MVRATGGVLQGRQRVAGHGRQDRAVGDGQQHQPVALPTAEPQRGAGVELPGRQRPQPGGELHAQARRHVEADPQDGRVERPVRKLLQPRAPGPGQELRQHEEPQEQLDQEGNVAEQLDPAGSQERGHPAGQRPQHAYGGAGCESHGPGAQRRQQRGAQAAQQHVAVGAVPVGRREPEDAPVPVVGHARPLGAGIRTCSRPGWRCPWVGRTGGAARARGGRCS